MPDARTHLLPSRAYLRSLKEQNIPMRRSAIADAGGYFERLSSDASELDRQLAVLGVVGEVMQAIEDVAALAVALTSSPPGVGFYAAAASPSERAVNKFYDQIGSWPIEQLLALLAFRIGEMHLKDAFGFEPPLSADEERAIGRAEEATARLVGEHLGRLASTWSGYRRYFHAFKHALVVANPEDVTLLEDRETEVPGLVVWQRRQPTATGVVGIHPPYEETVSALLFEGQLACDVLEQLVDTRLWLFEVVEITASGAVAAGAVRVNPWALWLREDDLTPEERAVLAVRIAPFLEPANNEDL
jgi:hypothetical protein